ncbi:MAG TPA: helix-turn-helix domain-containing protein [Candidatus Saccharimonadales bacterium]|nr:helix-turn-helix domain-containing protein [Candidatus Saccharimonadales bacterium]
MCPNPDEPTCQSVNLALQVIGDKWSGLIITALLDGARRFSELEQELHIGPRTLSQRLDSLEERAIVSKQVFAEAPPRVEYTLTNKGRDLLPILQSMAAWSQKYTV